MRTNLIRQKSSGYRSYHVVMYPVDRRYGTILNSDSYFDLKFLNTIEHSLNYKYKGDFRTRLETSYRSHRNLAYQLDEEMGAIRDAPFRRRKALFDQCIVSDIGSGSDDTNEDLGKDDIRISAKEVFQQLRL